MTRLIQFFKGRIRHKIVFFNALILIITLSIVAFLVYNSQKKRIVSETRNQMTIHLQDMVDLLDLQIKEKQLQVDISLEIARDQFNKNGPLTRDSITVTMEAVNQITKGSSEVTLPVWKVGNKQIHNNNEIVDEIQRLTGQTATIFQKINDGYLRISTNVRKLNGERAVGTYIPNSSEVIQTIERGETFRGRAFVVNDWYLTAYEPIRLNGNIVGILYVGVKEKDLSFLKEKFYAKHYIKSGYPYLLTKEGTLLIDPLHEGASVQDMTWFSRMRNEKEGVITNQWGGKENQTMMHFFTHYKFFDMTLAIAVPKAELLDDPLNSLRDIIFIGLSIILVGFLVLVSIFVRQQVAPLQVINDQLRKVADRKNVEPLTIDREDEVGTINESLNKVIRGFEGTTEFAKAIGERKFEVEFKALSDEDVLGQALINMRDSLKQAADDYDQRNWISQGHNKLNAIIRVNQDSIQNLCKALLPELVSYVNACQCGVFVQEQEGDKTYLELKGTYAWGRHRHNTGRIEVDPDMAHSLIDQVFLEKKYIVMNDLPDGFVNITSGLGEANPNNIIILPLIYNDEVMGVMEIATFNKIDQKIEEFLQQVAESMASTIESLITNAQTKKLLEETQKKTSEVTSMEEEVRQNLEEMQATNEEMNRKEREYLSKIAELEAKLKEKEDEK
ncbi:Cache 3/Cache 2 fusion domain-containing protein [Fulvivirga ligni]|uniref:Cache 3/Cache 2 fusion domain-containing protein n=1 Tax=Fulvivirga ligni TaxID=2904246 RepID=UPI001F2793EA|nr:Cache 3/Cache 2 fusion domain-containing protein [Fulvivirga ligni]UII18944.1 Cache 3/Cache 2 fusion domain-containing protein [Fulvivirga ligni]